MSGEPQAADPTSHNLWSFEILIYASLSLAAMGVLAQVRRAGAGRPAR